MHIEDRIKDQKILDIVHPDMAALSMTDNKLFAMARRNGLGASDASIYLGVNLYKTLDELIAEKRSTEITPEEIAIGEKPNVRKGKDLESLILQKFSEQMDIEVQKPKPMYQLIEHPQITINFDGVINMGDILIPVEAKWVSSYAEKFWDKTKCINTLFEGTEYMCGGSGVTDHITQQAQAYGIPAYYYTQLQQQLLGLDAPFGYFAVIFDKYWEFKVYKIFKDVYTQAHIITESKKVWDIVKR